MSTRRVVVPLRPGSDGDATHVPAAGTKTQVNPPTLYLEKIGQQWIEARGEAIPGVEYVLQTLPAGYTMWQRPRTSKPKHVDKYLYGHPQGRVFDSPNRYYPHFAFLMENGGSNMGCPCTVCAGSGGVLPKTSSNSARVRSSSAASSFQSSAARSSRPVSLQSRPSQVAKARPTPASTLTAQIAVPSLAHHSLAPGVQASTAPAPSFQIKGRPKLVTAGHDSSRIDEEGTPDVYRNLIDKLRRQGKVDENIEEPFSPDWLAEQKILPGLLSQLSHQDLWIPRVGDIVLYIRNLPSRCEITRDENDHFQVLDEENDEFLGTPLWEAGLVVQTPTELSTIADLDHIDDQTNIIYCGVRLEPIPDPNGSDKSVSKQYKYVSLRNTRPFILWRELLGKVPQNQWHATITNALTLTSTLSLMGKYHVRGTWPNLSIYCHGLYLGSEMLVVGDTVRLSPSVNKKQSCCMEVLVIKTIRLKWSELDKASNNDYDEGRPYKSEVWVYGSAYTSDPLQLNEEYLSDSTGEPPRATEGYGDWFPLHPASKELAVPYPRIMGRLYDRDTMSFWLSSDPEHPPDLDIGREALVEARTFSRMHYQRITEQAGATWYWGDTRADALNIQTINGLETTNYDQQRDIRDMRKNIKLIEAMENHKLSVPRPTMPLPLGSRGLRNFMAPGTATLPHRTGGARIANGNESGNATGSSSTSGGVVPGKKRPLIVNVSDEDEEEDEDDDEEEIRQHTKVVDEGMDVVGKKKARVMVVID
jgi:hypothetical protein